METEFRCLRMDELLAAHGLIVEVTDWLLKKGIDQWQKPFPLDLYRQRQEAGQNFGLFVGGELAAVVSLIPSYIPAIWADFLPPTPYTWLGTLATAIRFKGRDLGRVTLAQSEAWMARQGVPEIYLDCYTKTGVLLPFYTSAGYELITQRTDTFAGRSFESALLRKGLTVKT
jgi:acetyltransferase (GNAT) family protein